MHQKVPATNTVGLLTLRGKNIVKQLTCHSKSNGGGWVGGRWFICMMKDCTTGKINYCYVPTFKNFTSMIPGKINQIKLLKRLQKPWYYVYKFQEQTKFTSWWWSQISDYLPGKGGQVMGKGYKREASWILAYSMGCGYLDVIATWKFFKLYVYFQSL